MNKFSILFSPNELYDWLDLKLGIGDEYREIFEINHINANTFLTVDLKFFKDVGILSIGVRVKFLGIIVKRRKRCGIDL